MCGLGDEVGASNLSSLNIKCRFNLLKSNLVTIILAENATMLWLMDCKPVSFEDFFWLTVDRRHANAYLQIRTVLDLLLNARPPSPPPKRHECNFSTTASNDTNAWTATITITNARVAQAELVSWLEGDQLIVCLAALCWKKSRCNWHWESSFLCSLSQPSHGQSTREPRDENQPSVL